MGYWASGASDQPCSACAAIAASAPVASLNTIAVGINGIDATETEAKAA